MDKSSGIDCMIFIYLIIYIMYDYILIKEAA